MTEYSVSVPNTLITELIISFVKGPLLPDGRHERQVHIRKLVDTEGGLKMEIFANEHPPPHFRVRFQRSTANFAIKDCHRLNGSGEVLRYERNVRKWWQDHKEDLIRVWNEMRPSDCPVGGYREG